MPSVIIGVPMQRGQQETENFLSFMAIRKDLWQHGIQHHIATNETSVISYSRNGLADAFGNFDYLMWIDSDMQFPAYGVRRLIAADKDIVGGIYFRKDSPHNPLIFDQKEDGGFITKYDWPPDELFKVKAMGTGFMLIKRKVLDAFTPEVIAEMGKPFDLGRNPVTGKEMGEDLSFCKRVAKLGFEIWCDPTIPLGHLGKKVYNLEDYQNDRKFNDWCVNKYTYDNDIKGWMSRTELNWLKGAASTMDSVVEIGSWKGRSTHALLSGCKGTVWAVDHFEGSSGEEEMHHEAKEVDLYEKFMENVGMFPNLKALKMSSAEAVSQFEDKSVDMVFIDGGHTYQEVKEDIERWLPKARKLICGHDYNWISVQEAVTEHFGVPDLAETIWVKDLTK